MLSFAPALPRASYHSGASEEGFTVQSANRITVAVAPPFAAVAPPFAMYNL
jgi:hypothetical protein